MKSARFVLRTLALASALAIPSEMAAAPAVAPAAYGRDSADAILTHNREASGAPAWSGKSTLELRFSYAGQGLHGEVKSVEDLRSGAFVDTEDIGPTHQANGYDGRQAWMKDVSGTVTSEAGGDTFALAVNEAYRASQEWWRMDRGGARIEREAPRRADGQLYDVLAITPKGGKTFEAWFDASTHLLARIVEMRQFLTVTMTYSGYRAIDNVMLAHKVVVDDGSGHGGLQTQTLCRATFLPARPASAYSMRSSVPNDTTIQGNSTYTTLPFKLLNNHIYVTAWINNRGPFRFMVDTGGQNILMPRAAKALGLRVTGRTPSTGAGQNTAVSGYTHVNEIKLGAAIIRNEEVFVLRFQPDAVDGFPVDGMIGFPVLRRLVTRIDLRKENLDADQAGRP